MYDLDGNTEDGVLSRSSPYDNRESKGKRWLLCQSCLLKRSYLAIRLVVLLSNQILVF